MCHDTFFISGSLKIVLYILYILSSNYLVKPYTSIQLLDLCLLEACSSNIHALRDYGPRRRHVVHIYIQYSQLGANHSRILLRGHFQFQESTVVVWIPQSKL